MGKMNYFFVAVLVYLFATNISTAQVGIGTTTPEAHLDLSSTSAGLLIPRGALTSLVDVTTFTNPQGGGPVESTLIYNDGTGGVATPGFYYWDGTEWVMLTTKPSSDWTVLGNTGTNPTTNFVGTRDANALAFRTNNTEHVRIATDGKVGIGETNPTNGTLEVKGNLVIGDTYTGGNGVAQPGGLTIEGRTIMGDDDFFYAVDKLVVYGNTNWVPTGATSTDNGNGLIYAVNGYTFDGTAIYGEDNDGGIGVDGAVNGPATNRPTGTRGYDTGGNGIGVVGISADDGVTPTTGYIGVQGVESTGNGWAVLGIGDIGATGDGLFNLSDARLKKNITPFNNALSIVNQLEAKKYYMITDGKYKNAGFAKGEQIGFLAQDLEAILPGLVKNAPLPLNDARFTKEDLTKNPKLRNVQETVIDVKAVNYTKLIPILTQAIKEQQAQIKALQEKVETLENK